MEETIQPTVTASSVEEAVSFILEEDIFENLLKQSSQN